MDGGVERKKEMKVRVASLVAVILVGALLIITSCSSAQRTPNQQTPNQQTPNQQTPNQQTSNQTPEPPPTKLVKIVFDMGQADQGPGMEGYQGDFKPQIIHLPVGTTLTWENDDTFTLHRHNVTSKDGLFDKDLNVDESYNYTFTKPGTFDYYCKIYPQMTGKIIVE